MIVVFILIGALLIFRGMGALGVASLGSWPAASRAAMSVMLLFTAVGHFAPMKRDLVKMIPSWIPAPLAMVYFTGVCEILGAGGILYAPTRHLAAIALIVFFVAILPANIHAALASVNLRGRPVTALWLRIPVQIVFIALVWWAAIRNG